jgi:hypothetical protein
MTVKKMKEWVAGPALVTDCTYPYVLLLYMACTIHILRGVCVARLAPAPIPECLGVPGTMIFEALPDEIFSTSTSGRS